MTIDKQDKATRISQLVKERDKLETKIRDLNNTKENLAYAQLSCFHITININESDRLMLLEKAMNDLKRVHEDISALL